MKNKSLAIIILQSVLIIGLLWLIIFLGKDEIFKNESEEVEESMSFVSSDNKVITLSEKLIKNSGIKIQKISESKERPLYSSYGYVVNLRNLINFKTKYENLNFNLNQLNEQLNEKINHFKKLESLNNDNKIIADSVIHENEIEINNLQNDLQIVKNNKRNLLDVIYHEWGHSFKKLIANPNESILSNIFDSRSRLVKITITNDQIKKELPSKLLVFSINEPEARYEANFISEAPIGDKNIQGKSYYYLVPNSKLMIESKINSLTKLNYDSSIKKFYAPRSAIIWNNGKPWIYKAINKNSFLRQALSTMDEVKDGWIIEFNKTPPKSIVISGAQLLLSEEYKHLIKNENED